MLRYIISSDFGIAHPAADGAAGGAALSVCIVIASAAAGMPEVNGFGAHGGEAAATALDDTLDAGPPLR